MEKLPDMVLFQILEKIPRRELEDSVIFVSTQFQNIVLDILSENVRITEFCNEPPGYIDDLDLELTRKLDIATGWKCRWFDCEGLKRNYFEEFLRQLSPNNLEILKTPLRNEDQLDIITEMNNLTTLSLDILKPTLTYPIYLKLPRLTNLQKLQLDGSTMTADNLATLLSGCRFLTEVSFPRGTPWAEPDYLSLIGKSMIRRIHPWFYIGGEETEGQNYELLITVLETIPDLKSIEVHLHLWNHSRQDFDRKQKELLPQVAQLVSTQTELKSLSIVQADADYSENDTVDISVFNLAVLIQSLPQLEDFFISSSLRNYPISMISSIYRSIASLRSLKTLMLDEVPVNDAFKDIFNIPSLESLIIRRVTGVVDEETLEHFIACFPAIRRLKGLSSLRVTLNSERIGGISRAKIDEFEAKIQKAVVSCLTESNTDDTEYKFDEKVRSEWCCGGDQWCTGKIILDNPNLMLMLDHVQNWRIKELRLEGGWVNDQLVVELPFMHSLEKLHLIPSTSRIVQYG